MTINIDELAMEGFKLLEAKKVSSIAVVNNDGQLVGEMDSNSLKMIGTTAAPPRNCFDTMRFQLIRKEKWTHLEIVGNPKRDSEISARKLRNNCKRIVWFGRDPILHARIPDLAVRQSLAAAIRSLSVNGRQFAVYIHCAVCCVGQVLRAFWPEDAAVERHRGAHSTL